MKTKRVKNCVGYFTCTALLICAVLVLGTTAFSQNRAWTSTGSTGTIDDADLAIAELNNFVYGLKAGATGTVHVRFNITATEDIGKYCPAAQSTIKVRFRDSDGAGTNHSVRFTIRGTTLATGGNTVLYTFNSDAQGFPADSAFRTATVTPAIDFDFANSVYWIEAEVTRSVASAYAHLGSIQIYENSGAPCP
jgi:hypothetical protein